MSTATITRADIEAAMAAMAAAPYRVCQHVVKPPPAGMRWTQAEAGDPGATLLGCSAMCGFAMFAVVAPPEDDPTTAPEDPQ